MKIDDMIELLTIAKEKHGNLDLFKKYVVDNRFAIEPVVDIQLNTISKIIKEGETELNVAGICIQ